MTIRNMGRHHRELSCRLGDAEKLRLYAKAASSEHRTLEESLGKAIPSSDIRNGRPGRALRRRRVRKKRGTRLRRKLRFLG